MKYLVVLILLLNLYTSGSSAQENIQQVDFNNFTYPLSGDLFGHDRLQWLNMPGHARADRPPIHLVKGSDLTKTSSFVMDGKEYSQYEGFTLQSIKFADLTGDGKEEAIVVLRYHTGGTQTTDYVYVYTLEPTLLAYCHTGDRAHSGLYDVYGKDEMLVFELFDHKRASGDCCSSGILITRYKWHNARFETVGSIEPRSLATAPPNR